MNRQNGIIVESDTTMPILRMVWSANSAPEDVLSAYQTIREHLETVRTPHDLVVDLREQPTIPVREIVSGALDVYTHSMVRNWLIVGGDERARAAANMLFGITGEQKILWFSEYNHMDAYLST